MIHYIVPTRGRPENAGRLIQAFVDTCHRDDTGLVFCVDGDDPRYDDYMDLFAGYPNGLPRQWMGYIAGPRVRMGPTLNSVATNYAKGHPTDLIGFMGDDHLPRTPGWDDRLASAFLRNRDAVAYGNDLVQGASLPTAVLLSAHTINAMGFMVPPGIKHLYIDNFWRDLGIQLGTLAYLPDVIIEHLHPIAHQAEWDQTYTEANDGALYAEDAATYHNFQLSGAFNDAVRRVQA
jgi:hypothetical protein